MSDFVYRCSKCGKERQSYSSKCDSCGSWNTLRHHATGGFPSGSSGAAVVGAFVDGGARVLRPAVPARAGARAIPSTSVELVEIERLRTGWVACDRTLGGRTPGYGRRATYVLSGEPGIGKSTLAIQHARGILEQHPTECALYVTAEMPIDQCRSVVGRTNAQHANLLLLEQRNVDEVIACMRSERPAFVVVDSWQAIRHPLTSASAGTTAQVLRCGNDLKDAALELRCALVFLGRVIKDQTAAGPKEIEHLVDAVCHFDRVGPYVDDNGVRVPLTAETVRTFAVSKSRVGPSASTRLRMTEEGILVDHVENKPHDA